jgi:hypothetical protein
MNANIINDLKALDWQTIINFGNSLSDLDEAQLRFLKGLVVELTVEKYSDIKYVGDVHRDFEWKRHSVDIELKSQLSLSMHTKKEKLCKTFNIQLSNSYGTNNQDALDLDNVADILIVVRKDGAFVIDRHTVMEHAVKRGDGWFLKIPNTKINDLTGLIKQQTTYQSTLKQDIINLIKQAIPAPKVSEY